jgi:hypothetical protein
VVTKHWCSARYRPRRKPAAHKRSRKRTRGSPMNSGQTFDRDTSRGSTGDPMIDNIRFYQASYAVRIGPFLTLPSRDEILTTFDRINVWSRGSERAPHCPGTRAQIKAASELAAVGSMNAGRAFDRDSLRGSTGDPLIDSNWFSNGRRLNFSNFELFLNGGLNRRFSNSPSVSCNRTSARGSQSACLTSTFTRHRDAEARRRRRPGEFKVIASLFCQLP